MSKLGVFKALKPTPPLLSHLPRLLLIMRFFIISNQQFDVDENGRYKPPAVNEKLTEAGLLSIRSR